MNFKWFWFKIKWFFITGRCFKLSVVFLVCNSHLRIILRLCFSICGHSVALFSVSFWSFEVRSRCSQLGHLYYERTPGPDNGSNYRFGWLQCVIRTFGMCWKMNILRFICILRNKKLPIYRVFAINRVTEKFHTYSDHYAIKFCIFPKPFTYPIYCIFTSKNTVNKLGRWKISYKLCWLTYLNFVFRYFQEHDLLTNFFSVKIFFWSSHTTELDKW